MKEQKYLKIIGNRQINGIVKVSGSKNAALPLIAAALLVKGKTILHNVPDILDVTIMIKIINYLNVKTSFKDNTLIIDTTKMKVKDLNIEEVRQIRASYYLIGPLLEEFSSIKFYDVGGCNFDARPIDLHLDILKNVGCKISKNEDAYNLKIDRFNDLNYKFERKSLGATINAILIGAKTKKNVKIENYSLEPEVDSLLGFLSKAGLLVNKNEKELTFSLEKELLEVEYDVIPDRIEAETFALLGLALGKIGIFDFVKEHHASFLKLLDENKVFYEIEDNFLKIDRQLDFDSNYIILGEYPLIPTDIGPILLSFSLLCNKFFMFEDLIYPYRLSKLTFFYNTFSFNQRKLLVNPTRTIGNNKCFYGTNLRDTMAYLFYCLTHDGEYNLFGLQHLFRGYENIIDKLISLNCKVNIIDE